MISTNIVKNRNTRFNSATNEWYTPHYIIDSVKKVLGDIDLDPASNDIAQQYIQARQYYTIETNGFDKQWNGKVFLNPPYGTVNGKSAAGIWLEKLIDEYRAGNVTEAIAIVNAVPDKKWFKIVYQSVFCLTDGGLKFIAGANNPNSKSVYASAIAYLGNNVDTFAEEFSQYGEILVKYKKII